MFKRKIKKSKVLPIVFPKNNKFNETKCVICYSNFENDNEVSLPCGHAFHSDCILTWMSKKMECPYCKIKLSWTSTRTRSVSVDSTDECENK